jgi:signal transduction histidine kinase
MTSPKRNLIITLMKTIFFLIAFWMAPQYLTAQSHQQDTAAINRLLTSAKNKRFTDSSTALQEAHQALRLAQKHNDGFWIYKSYHRIARIHEVNGQKAKANYYFCQELSVVDAVSDDTKQYIYAEIADSYIDLSKYSEAFEVLTKIEVLGDKTQNISIKQQSCLYFGTFYSRLNDFEKATQYLVKSVDYALKLNNTREIHDSYQKLASVYLNSKNYDLALKNAEKAMLYVSEIDNYTYAHYYIYQNYGNLLFGCGKPKEAITTLEKALKMSIAEGDKTCTASIYISMADVYNDLGDLPKVTFCYEQCDLLNQDLTDYDLMAFNYGFGDLLFQKKAFKEAIAHLEKSVDFAMELKDKTALQSSYALLAKAYEAKKDDHQSLIYLKKSVDLQDSIFSEKNTKRILEAQFKYDLGHSEEKVKTMKTRQVYTLIISVFIVLCLFIAFLVYFLRSKNQKNRFLLEKTQILTETTRIVEVKNRQLEESNEILKQFAFASAHDLKEPLRSINSFVNLIQRRYLKEAPPEAHEYMGFVTTGVKRMESLLNALLEYSSVLTDDNTTNEQNNVLEILKTVCQMHENLMTEKKAVVKGPSVFPTISMDKAHLKLLLDNLVSNALKFSKTDAKIEVNYTITDTECIVSVHDEGIGLDKSYGDKIFKLFQRLDRVTHKESVGIGLTICKNIMDKYAGRIWFDSVAHEGTTFYIAFPKNMVSGVPTAKGAPQYFGILAADLIALNTQVPT